MGTREDCKNGECTSDNQGLCWWCAKVVNPDWYEDVMHRTWRDRMRPLIAEVIERVGKSDLKALKKALLDARPNWVIGASWMTKVWRDEVKCQLGKKQFGKPRQAALSKDQLKLF